MSAVAPEIPDMQKTSFHDAVIVGSGAGGSAAAYQLARAGLDVVLLEKGRDLPRDGTTLDIGKVVHEGRFKAREAWRDGRGRPLEPEEHFNVGGKTRWYGAALLRYSPAEFAADVEHQCPGWPVTYDELRPHYEEAERLLGVRQFDCEPDLARIVGRLERGAWRAEPLPLGLDTCILANPVEARHFDGFASVAGLKGDAARAFLQPLRDLPNFSLCTGEPVTELLADTAQPLRINGVRTANGREYRAPHVLLAAGALHTPRIVQRYLRERSLERMLPAARQVGRNLKLHLLTAVVAVAGRRQTDLLRKTMLLTHPDLPHSSVQPLGFDGELLAGLIPGIVPRVVANAVGARSYGFFLQTEDGSHPDNRVSEGVAGGTPVLDYDPARLGPALAEHRRLVARLSRSLTAAGLAPFSKRIGLAGTAHACGTMIAGHDPGSSVVDRDGRVHGMEGLYVVDGSVLPRSSRVNPSLSIFGWSMRAADRLARTVHESRRRPGTLTAVGG
jgi:choline dehydrogenase-like flavoprotein